MYVNSLVQAKHCLDNRMLGYWSTQIILKNIEEISIPRLRANTFSNYTLRRYIISKNRNKSLFNYYIRTNSSEYSTTIDPNNQHVHSTVWNYVYQEQMERARI